jgi:4-methyl-5(b-hydroxyethyl)-thiazole monophosphate biosynthesis
MPTVLAILAEGFEEIEAITPIDLLRRAGAAVTIAALGSDRDVTGRSGITVRADIALAAFGTTAVSGPTAAPGAVADAVFPPLYDCLLLPGGPGVKQLRSDPRVRTLVLRHHAADRCLAAICAAPILLHDAGLLTGRRFTAHFSVADELPDFLAAERVVVDGHLLTSRGAGTSLDFALALVKRLFGAAKAEEVARSISA